MPYAQAQHTRYYYTHSQFSLETIVHIMHKERTKAYPNLVHDQYVYLQHPGYCTTQGKRLLDLQSTVQFVCRNQKCLLLVPDILDDILSRRRCLVARQ